MGEVTETPQSAGAHRALGLPEWGLSTAILVPAKSTGHHLGGCS